MRSRRWSRSTSLMSHLETTTSVAQPALRASSATVRSWSVTPSEESTSTSATSAPRAASMARSSLQYSTSCRCLRRRRRPAVSIRRYVVPSRSRRMSMESRVVPGTSETITRGAPTSALTRLDLPTFGRPRMATRISSLTSSWRAASGISASRSTIRSSRSPEPVPCRPETGTGSPRPSAWNSTASRSTTSDFGLVGDDDRRHLRPAQDRGDLLVARPDADAACRARTARGRPRRRPGAPAS